MRENGPSRIEAWLAFAALLLTIIGATITTYGRITALEQHMADFESNRANMQTQLDRIESKIEVRP